MGAAPREAAYHAWSFLRTSLPLIWAHRGASAARPENTVEAFVLAEEMGADGIECDVRLCGSGELVVCHDPTLERLAGLPVAVRELPYPELARLPLLRDRFPEAEGGIPTLAAAVGAVGPGMRWNIELKVERSAEAEALAEAAVREILRLPLEGRVLVSSFHPQALLTVRSLAPELPTAYLWEGEAGVLQRWWHALAQRLCANAAVHPPAAIVTGARVQAWRRRGYAVNTWTVDEPEALRALSARGVDGIITNRPDLARSTLEA